MAGSWKKTTLYFRNSRHSNQAAEPLGPVEPVEILPRSIIPMLRGCQWSYKLLIIPHYTLRRNVEDWCPQYPSCASRKSPSQAPCASSVPSYVCWLSNGTHCFGHTGPTTNSKTWQQIASFSGLPHTSKRSK